MPGKPIGFDTFVPHLRKRFALTRLRATGPRLRTHESHDHVISLQLLYQWKYQAGWELGTIATSRSTRISARLKQKIKRYMYRSLKCFPFLSSFPTRTESVNLVLDGLHEVKTALRWLDNSVGKRRVRMALW